jgi:hypothetical protein
MIGTLVGLALLLFAVVLLPLLALKVLFGLVVGLVLLPFKLLGGLFRLVGGLFGLVFKGLFAGAGVLAILLALVLVPLLPLLFLGFLFWAVLRLFTRPALARA